VASNHCAFWSSVDKELTACWERIRRPVF
jgi:hypothetical protein